MANIKRANASGITKSGTAISDVPDAPTIGAVSDLGTGSTASVAYTAATTGGAATTFTATSSPGGFTGTGSSPITVSGLSTDTAYTFTVVASNSTGSSPASSASSSVTLVIPGKFESIASAAGTGSSGTITFSSIPSTYTSLQLRCISRNTATGTGSGDVLLRFNSDTGSNYAYAHLRGNGSVAGASSSSTQTSIKFDNFSTNNGETSGVMTAAIIDIHDYASTARAKTVRAFTGNDNNGNSTAIVRLNSGLWTSTSAITTLTLTLNLANNFTTNSIFALYGIKGA